MLYYIYLTERILHEYETINHVFIFLVKFEDKDDITGTPIKPNDWAHYENNILRKLV